MRLFSQNQKRGYAPPNVRKGESIMAWVKHKLGNMFKYNPHETEWHILYKVVDTKTPHLKKLIIRSINHQRKKDLARTGMFLVRDGFIVKPCKKKDKSLVFLAKKIGYKAPIRSLNLGALYKKYNIPKSTGKIIAASDAPHTLAINFKYLLEVFDGSIDNANKVLSIAGVSIGATFHKRRRASVTELLGYLSTERKIEMLEDAFICDTASSFQTISLSVPQQLENFDWTQSARRIHDDLARICDRLLNPDRYTPISYQEKTIESIDLTNQFLSKSKLRLKLAENGMDLLVWGQHLSHCIGGYTRPAITGAANEYCVLVGVYEEENEKPTWTIQMKAVGEKAAFWTIVQFYGKYNSPPSPEIRTQVEEGLLFSRSQVKRKEYENKVLSGSGV